jgi:hypothetical protein
MGQIPEKSRIVRAIRNKLSMNDISVIWYSVFETSFSDENPGVDKDNGVINLVEEASKKNKLTELMSVLIEDYPYINLP